MVLLFGCEGRVSVIRQLEAVVGSDAVDFRVTQKLLFKDNRVKDLQRKSVSWGWNKMEDKRNKMEEMKEWEEVKQRRGRDHLLMEERL